MLTFSPDIRDASPSKDRKKTQERGKRKKKGPSKSALHMYSPVVQLKKKKKKKYSVDGRVLVRRKSLTADDDEIDRGRSCTYPAELGISVDGGRRRKRSANSADVKHSLKKIAMCREKYVERVMEKEAEKAHSVDWGDEDFVDEEDRFFYGVGSSDYDSVLSSSVGCMRRRTKSQGEIHGQVQKNLRVSLSGDFDEGEGSSFSVEKSNERGARRILYDVLEVEEGRDAYVSNSGLIYEHGEVIGGDLKDLVSYAVELEVMLAAGYDILKDLVVSIRLYFPPENLFDIFIEKFKESDDSEKAVVIEAICYWVKMVPEDFKGILGSVNLMNFVKELYASPETNALSWAEHISGSWESCDDTYVIPVSNYEFNSLDEYAEQLFLIDCSLLRQMTCDTLLKDPSSVSQNTNLVSRWVAMQILTIEDIEERAKEIKFFIQLCLKLWEWNSFNALFAVYNGLSFFCISRLKRTWKKVSSKYKAIFKDIGFLCSPHCNFTTIQNIIKEAKGPAVPFLMPYMVNVNRIKETSAQTEVSGKLYITKMNAIRSEFENLTKYQTPELWSKTFFISPKLNLQKLDVFTEEELEDISSQLE
eukprot:TRINITY_DN503_c0_g1_i2.p1 TRINITY_DN503_c0_g1~~TRINITY_DN503_c0_g1_i2.p1  ORF type:complete len:588 (-),score=115.00 TRINITY_DN503_c0_g1_i2:206-1969(-)